MSIKKRVLIALVLVLLVVALAGGAIYVCFFRSDNRTGGSSGSLTEKDFQRIEEADEKLNNIRNGKKYAKMDPDEQMEVMLDAINELADKKLIKADTILCDEDELYITFEYACGVLGAATFGRNDELAGTPGNTFIDGTFEDWEDDVIASKEQRASAVILDAYVNHENGSDDPYLANQAIEMAKKWSKLGVDTTIDYTVTLEDLANLDGNSFVLFMMHGDYQNFENLGKVPALLLEQQVNSDTDYAFEEDLAAHRIIRSDSSFYAVVPSFFEAHYGSEETRLDDCIFFFDSCVQKGDGADYSDTWNTVCEEIGVSTAVAFHNSVIKKYGMDLAEMYMDCLLGGDTAYEAYDEAALKWGGSDKEWIEKLGGVYQFDDPAVPYFIGDYDAKFKWYKQAAPTPSPTPTPIVLNATLIGVGDEITMGCYAGEDIKWIVLDANDNNILVISKDIIEAKPFNKSDADVTWETCSLRKWLNEDFYQTAFSSNEKEKIQKALVVTPDNPVSGAEGGNNTEDYIYLLSIDEANNYFSSNKERRASIADYINESDLRIFDGGYSFWWLRSPSSIPLENYDQSSYKYYADIGASGNIDEWGGAVTTLLGVRPVMRISFDEVNAPPAEVTVQISDEAKAAYLNKINEITYNDFESEWYGVPTSGRFTYDLIYVDNDDIPELLVCLTISGGPNGDEVFANLYAYSENDHEVYQIFQRWAADRFDAHTHYYPRENIVCEFIRMNASEYESIIATIYKDSATCTITSYYIVYEGEGDSMTITYYLYDTENHKRICEINEKEYNVLSAGKGEPQALIATMTKTEITKILS